MVKLFKIKLMNYIKNLNEEFLKKKNYFLVYNIFFVLII